jgi:hypothetical protein
MGKSMIDKYELLELFESEPRVIDEEAGMYEYKKEDAFGFTLKMTIFLYDGFCSLTLRYKNFEIPIFDLGFDKIDCIKCKEDKLIIQQSNNPKNVVVHFKPNYFLRLEDRLPL